MARRGLVKICAILLIAFTGVTFYQRLTMECGVARKNSAHFERVYNEAQDEVAEWRRKYDAESARAEECNSQLTRDLHKRIEELENELASAQKGDHKHVDKIIQQDSDLPNQEKVMSTVWT
eukprot:TRINITY_DN1229_c0_g1_i3.p1 TRINITY_DN1229_c0_g1~~TRINITY_DN1229_c0_g1_i3.p1  ORF type:complete len:121 (+),score=23.23 TRINITY_DN1229_c0_g1_i3:306-668(+)